VRSILFVCAGNICRSPIAEALFGRIAKGRGALASLEVGSAGTLALEGNPPTAEAIRASREEFGLEIAAHRARNISGLDADLILTMDHMVRREVSGMRLRGRVELLGDYAGTGEIVEDPYGCPGEVYRACARHLEELLRAAADRLERELEAR